MKIKNNLDLFKFSILDMENRGINMKFQDNILIYLEAFNKKGKKFICINQEDYDFNFTEDFNIIVGNKIKHWDSINKMFKIYNTDFSYFKEENNVNL